MPKSSIFLLRFKDLIDETSDNPGSALLNTEKSAQTERQGLMSHQSGEHHTVSSILYRSMSLIKIVFIEDLFIRSRRLISHSLFILVSYLFFRGQGLLYLSSLECCSRHTIIFWMLINLRDIGTNSSYLVHLIPFCSTELSETRGGYTEFTISLA